MRIFMSVQIPTQSGNESIKSGALPQVMGKFIETFRPEAAYFITSDGDRCAHFYFEMKDVTQMPSVAEPFFIELGAKVTYCPAMNPDDLKKGIAAFMASR
jgi:hypothetical protein